MFLPEHTATRAKNVLSQALVALFDYLSAFSPVILKAMSQLARPMFLRCDG
jgi:hypothetical protein